MPSNEYFNNKIAQRVMFLFYLDARAILERIKARQDEYISILSLKRDRSHFKEIFYTRYFQTDFETFLYLGEEIVVALDQFYKEVESLNWYLCHTEDLPQATKSKVEASVRELEGHLEVIKLYIKAEKNHFEEKGEAARSPD